MAKPIEILNRRAAHDFHFLSKHEAGIVLVGTEIKSIRSGHANLTDAYCIFQQGELFVQSMYIKEYENASYGAHEGRRQRKLLLHKSELKKLERKVKEKGLTLIPYRIFMNERNIVKIEVALAQGKKSFDKRHTIKEKDTKREIDRMKKIRL
jgi:SsrA-binding protein